MRTRRILGLSLLCGTLAAALSGCAPVQIPIPVTFGGEGLSFDVTAGQKATSSGPVSIDRSNNIQIGSGRIRLSTDAITVIPAEEDGQKLSATLQDTNVLEITVHLGPLDSQATVCETGDTYGPFEVTLDENFVPVSISPSSVTLTQSTIDLLNLGEFSFCVEVVSPVSGEVIIEGMTFAVGL